MFAAVVHAPFDIRYEEVETPVPKRGEVRVKVKYTGICGSDIPRVNGNACHFFPIILGHEFSGEIDAVGEAVSGLEPGDHVAGIPLIPCMQCDDCRQGNFSLCRHYTFIGSRRNGSFAEYAVVPAANVFKTDPSIPFWKAAFFEPSAVAVHALRTVGFMPGYRTAVVGCGPIGLLTLQWCRIMGASSVTAINRSRGKLEVAKQLGADHLISTLDEDYYEQAMNCTGGKGFDFVFDATGNADMMKETFRIAANRAKICMVGTPKKEMNFTVQEWELMNRKEFTLTGSWMSYSAPFPGEEWKLTEQCFANGKLSITEDMIDEIIGLSRIDTAFEKYRQPGGVSGKILINSEK